MLRTYIHVIKINKKEKLKVKPFIDEWKFKRLRKDSTVKITTWVAFERNKDNITKNKDLKGKLIKNFKGIKKNEMNRQERITDVKGNLGNYIINNIKFKEETNRIIVIVQTQTETTNGKEKSDTKENGKLSETFKNNLRSVHLSPLPLITFIGNILNTITLILNTTQLQTTSTSTISEV